MSVKTIKIIFTLLLFCAVLLNLSAVIDSRAINAVDAALQRAVSAFAIARSLNAVLSVAQATEVAIEPMGLGLTFKPGELLDPVNDLVERFSWIMLGSSVVYGIQKILLAMSAWPLIKGVITAVFMLTLLLLWLKRCPGSLTRYALKMSIVLAFLRFSIPLVSVGNAWVYDEFLQQQYQQAAQDIKQHESTLRAISKSGVNPLETADNLLQKLTDAFNAQPGIQAQIQKLEQQVTELAQAFADAIINLIVVFVLQTVIFPLLLLYGCYKLMQLVLKIDFI